MSLRLRLSRRSSPGLRVGDRAHAVPLDLIRPAAVLVAAARPARASIGTIRAGIGSRSRVRPAGPCGGSSSPSGRSPVVDREQRVARVHALAVQRHLDLARLPLQALVRAAVPDRHRARAVLALRDLRLEVQVLERVVLRLPPRGDFRRAPAAGPSAPPTRRARRRARGAGPSAAASRGARGSRTAAHRAARCAARARRGAPRCGSRSRVWP